MRRGTAIFRRRLVAEEHERRAPEGEHAAKEEQ